MTAAKIHSIIEWVLYGTWNALNVSAIALIRFFLPDENHREAITWATQEAVTVLTGISVLLAIALTIKKLFFPKKK